ncbi:MAG TPA: hypothetical protein VFS20_14315 [Longimicrobium sp.]|nr:hypothetical protein [Longimicrobium sp.]
MRIAGALMLLCACAGAACAAARRARGQAIPDIPPRGWTIPQDSVDALFTRANLVFVHPRTSGPYPANLVIVAFRRRATPAQRQQAVAAVRGTVIGGDGVYYFIRVDGRCADHPVWCAIDILEPLPQVDEAHPLLWGGTTGMSARVGERVPSG